RPQYFDKTTNQLLDHQGVPKQHLTSVPKDPDHPLAEVPKHEPVPVGVGAHTADVTAHTPGGTAGHTPGGVAEHTPGGVADHGAHNTHTEPGGGTPPSHGGTDTTHTTGGTHHTDTPSTGGGHDGPATGGGGHGDGPTIPHQGGHDGALSETEVPKTDEPGTGTPSERPAGPAPAYTAEEKAAHWTHLEEVEVRHPESFDELKRDPDKNGGVNESSMDEARVGLDLAESGRLPDDIARPHAADHGEFYSETTGRYYDIKGVHSDYPPFNNIRNKNGPFKGAYTPARDGAKWEAKVSEQIVDRGRIVILDMRNADQVAIDDIRGIIERNGWENDVIWYP
ncbi:hypothetical protein AB0D15_02985, partial [Streptomyces sp. NPDC048551]